METQNKVKQTDAVYNAVLETLGPKFTAGQSFKALITKEVKKKVRSLLIEAFKSGKVKLSKQKNDAEIAKYVSNLINDRLRKDSRLK